MIYPSFCTRRYSVFIPISCSVDIELVVLNGNGIILTFESLTKISNRESSCEYLNYSKHNSLHFASKICTGVFFRSDFL